MIMLLIVLWLLVGMVEAGDWHDWADKYNGKCFVEQQSVPCRSIAECTGDNHCAYVDNSGGHDSPRTTREPVTVDTSGRLHPVPVDECPQRMRDAMKAMDDQLINVKHYLQILYGYANGFEHNQASIDAYNRNNQRLKQLEDYWDAVMQECVKP